MQLSHSRSTRRVIRRVRVTASDVIWPAFILLHTNLMFLFAWTFSPFRLSWKRTYIDSFDSLGRQVESYGGCRPDDGTLWFLMFVIPLYLTNFLVLIRATYACYIGRRLPTEFSETRYLLAALISLTEVSVVGGTYSSFAIDNCLLRSMHCAEF
jgi:hypothetical protein